ncbi:hypothetical protein FDE76_15590 [Clostridium botulinum]|uniref:KilA-N DNA-binding domain-containing protein n=1 Tax=Clostridium botulinum (strain Eklund 17B / Type B) TaxID=935198 RepID=B2TM25_CLOBB|nr:conserved hypothetical protein [Clostridium botulinum B str. Eklund 17B (NRP)]MBY6977094.1 ORF6C domain-containing protein [Clostridium botulinum]MBY6999252.1 ORF6C domain-containing protein [Clostridium botulinum]MCR1272667.1 ORF6C domain-containing protein [Clostridium botulinum]NFD69964.1 hypothetical protein [Clostridium botulinum]
MDKKILEVSQIKLRGIKEVEGMKFHDIEGGFGESKKAMLAKEIAEIHRREVKKVNELINNNRKRFKDNVDIIDLKTGLSKRLVLEMGFTNAQYGNANNIYLLSERGYSKLLKILEDDVAWEQYEKLVDGYFNMRAEFPKMSKELKAIFAIDERTVELDSRITKLENNTTIDYSQQEELRTLGTKKVVAILGGTDAPAYKELNKKVFSSFWRDYKRKLEVNSYKNTLVKDFETGKQAIINWCPSKEVYFMIRGCNAQMRM